MFFIKNYNEYKYTAKLMNWLHIVRYREYELRTKRLENKYGTTTTQGIGRQRIVSNDQKEMVGNVRHRVPMRGTRRSLYIATANTVI